MWYKNNFMWVCCEVILLKLYVGFCCSLWWWSHAYYKTWTGNVLFYMASYCQTQKTVNTKIFTNVDCVVINHNKVQAIKQTSKPQTDYRFCLRCSFHVPYWLFPCNTVTFRKYFLCSLFWEFHSNRFSCFV